MKGKRRFKFLTNIFIGNTSIFHNKPNKKMKTSKKKFFMIFILLLTGVFFAGCQQDFGPAQVPTNHTQPNGNKVKSTNENRSALSVDMKQEIINSTNSQTDTNKINSDADKKSPEQKSSQEKNDTTAKNNNQKTMENQQNDNNATNINMEFAQTCEQATLKTNMGDIVIELYGDKAPTTVANFCTLADKGFYDGIKFHRVIDGFMIQAGDPQSKDDAKKNLWGTGGPGYEFKDELPQPGEYKLGSVAMANAGPNTNGSQFFIVSGPSGVNLPPAYSLFGEVIEGMDVVEKIQKVETETNDRPVSPVVIEKVELKLKK